MQRDAPVRICPICKSLGTVKKKWTRNRSGKKYTYELFNHEGMIHWVRADGSLSKRREKNEIQKELVGFLNSTRFKQAIFTVNDIVSKSNERGLQVSYPQARVSLLNLVNSGLLYVAREEGKLFFINNSGRDRLNYVMKKVSITLEDSIGEGLFERHFFKARILNDNDFPLQYILLTIAGDNERNKERLSFSSFDITAKNKSNIYFLEDAPQKKRVVIELGKPLQPDEERTISIEYFWPEIGPSHTFSAQTPLEFIRFSLVSNKEFNLSVIRTNAQRTRTEDESSRVFSATEKDNLKVKRFEINNLLAHAALTFRWSQQ